MKDRRKTSGRILAPCRAPQWRSWFDTVRDRDGAMPLLRRPDVISNGGGTLVFTAEMESGQDRKKTPGRYILCRFLDPTDCLAELLVGVVLALTITLGASLVVGKAPESTKHLMLAILGCNLAWGLIDGAIHLMSCMLDRSRKTRLIQSVRNAEGPAEAIAIVEREFDSRLESFTTQEERARLYQTVLERLDGIPEERPSLMKEDLLGAASVFCAVVFCAIPALAPFLVFRDRFVALRVSNVLLLTLLFLAGFRHARATLGNPWVVSFGLLAAGCVLVAATIALGG
jgi:hypothetical protein